MKRYEVQSLIGNDWENVWSETNKEGKTRPMTFMSRAVAAMAIAEHIRDLKREGMDCDDEYRIRAVTA